MPVEKSVGELKAEIAAMQKRISELSDKNSELQDSNYSLDRTVRDLQKEKDKLLAIIDNLSKGFATLSGKR